MRLKAVIFDFGNVIYKFDNDIFLAKIAPYTAKSVTELNKLIYEESNLPELLETGRITAAEFIRDIKKLCELEISDDLFIKAYTRIFTPVNPTIKLIDELKGNYRLGLLSNTSSLDYENAISAHPYIKAMDTITLSYKVGALKPSRKIYEDALSRLQLAPEQCVYIDDIQAYAAAAKQLGLKAIHYQPKTNLKSELRKLGVSV